MHSPEMGDVARKSRRAIPSLVAGRSGAVPTPSLRPAGVAMKPFAPLRNRLRQGATEFPECITGAWELPVSRKLSLLGISPGLCRGGAATFQWPPCSSRRPISLAPSSCEVLTAQVRMLVSERHPPAVQLLPSQSLADVESHAFGVELGHDLFQISRPALRPRLPGGARSPSSSRIYRRRSLHIAGMEAPIRAALIPAGR